MIRNVLFKLGSLRSALAVGVGVPFLLAGTAFGQVGSTQPTPPPSGPSSPGTPSGSGSVMDSASVDANAENPATGGATNAATTERVVVTGSYIPTAETESALPVTVYTSTVLQKQGANTPGGRSASVAVVSSVTLRRRTTPTAVTVRRSSTCALSASRTRSS
jgi:hypothetical protein